MTGDYLGRLVDDRLAALLAALPAVLVAGPRACGKTTSAKRLAATVVRLDRPAEAAVFRADPDVALAEMPEPVLLDEWQEAPEVLGAVGRAVDEDPRPGRFLLAGSVRADLDARTWPGGGRLVRLAMYGLTVREILGRVDGPAFVDRLAEADLDVFPASTTPHNLRDYIELALRGGFPDAVLRLGGTARQAWLDGYLNQLLTRDAASLGRRDPARLRRYFEALAANTAGVVHDKTLFDTAGLDRKTADAYRQLLVDLHVLDVMPAWSTNRLSRLAKGPKYHLVDPALVGAALRLDRETVLRDGNLLERLIDTFVAAQLRPELELGSSRARLYHLRDGNGRHEVDVLAELGADRVVAIEVKATAAPRADDAKHLFWLQERLGDRFVAGAVLHTGPHSHVLGNRIFALPISTIWS